MKEERIEEKKGTLKFIITTLAITAAISLMIKPVIVKDISMNPTLQDGDYLILSRTAEVEKGDIVVFKANVPLIKRVVATEGDTVKVDGSVYVNGKAVKKANGKMDEITVPKGEFFVLGDNVNHSVDSRELGTIPEELIQGVAKVRLFPSPKTL